MNLNQLYLAFLLCIFNPLLSQGQEYRAGGFIGGLLADPNTLNLEATIDYTPNGAAFYFESGITLTAAVVDKQFQGPIATLPLNLCFAIGTKVIFEPVMGVYIRSNGHTGFGFGAGLGTALGPKTQLFIRSTQIKELYTESNPRGGEDQKASSYFILFRIGLKRRLKL